jgi:hypothetical protein
MIITGHHVIMQNIFLTKTKAVILLFVTAVRTQKHVSNQVKPVK